MVDNPKPVGYNVCVYLSSAMRLLDQLKKASTDLNVLLDQCSPTMGFKARVRFVRYSVRQLKVAKGYLKEKLTDPERNYWNEVRLRSESALNALLKDINMYMSDAEDWDLLALQELLAEAIKLLTELELEKETVTELKQEQLDAVRRLIQVST